MLRPNKAPEPEVLVAMIDSIKIFYIDHESAFSVSEKRLITSLPAKSRILNDMDESQMDVLYRSVRHIWQSMVGKDPEFESENKDATDLNGSYWMMPGGILLHGYNHFQAAKENKLLVCSLLDINPLVFEKLIASCNTGDIISLILARGGVRTFISRERSEVVMQTNESSWTWVKNKLEKMYHKNKIAKVVDLSRPYEGWISGVTIRVT